jgi:hypothetical protein
LLYIYIVAELPLYLILILGECKRHIGMFQLTNHYICNCLRVLDTGFGFRFIRQTTSEHSHLLVAPKSRE